MVRLAVVGKGGAGKSVVAGTIARMLARGGDRVLALDSDLMPGLAISLGAAQPPVPPLLEAAERDEDGRWGLKKGIGPARAVRRYATPAPDGVLLLQAGKVSAEGLPAILGAINAFYRVVHRLPRTPAFSDWSIVGDLPAGPRQTAFGWAPYARAFLLVVEPTTQSVLTARRIGGIVRAREGREVLPVANKVTGAADRRRIETLLGESLFAWVPADDAVREAERQGAALLDHAPSAPATRALHSVAERLRGYAPTE